MEFDAQPFPSIKEIVYDPAGRFVRVKGSVVPLAEPLIVPVHDKSPVPEPETVINPVEVPHAVGPDWALADMVVAAVTSIVIGDDVEVHP
jgi:hypothetical protein